MSFRHHGEMESIRLRENSTQEAGQTLRKWYPGGGKENRDGRGEKREVSWTTEGSWCPYAQEEARTPSNPKRLA